MFGKSSKVTCGELVPLACLSDSVGPSGKVPEPEGSGGERQSCAERSCSQISPGFMELCTSDPPPWIAIRDHSFTFYLCCCAALFLRFPSSTLLTKVRQLCVCLCVCVCVCVPRYGVRSPRTYCPNLWRQQQQDGLKTHGEVVPNRH